MDISSIIFFDNSSFRYSEYFKFGTDIILDDIAKICSINKETIINFLSNNFFNKEKFEENEFLEDKFFTKNNFRNIDFLNIDAEAHDMEVLEGFNLNKFKPQLICIELYNKKLNLNEKLFNDFLRNYNYSLIKKIGPNGFYSL